MGNRPRLFYGYKIAAYCYVITMVVWGTYNSFGIFFDSLLSEFHMNRAATSGAFSLCTILSGLAAIPLGKITDKFGARLVMTVCSLLLGGGYILMSQINAVWQYYLVYGVVIGIGTAGFWVPVLSTVSHWFSRKRGLMVGFVLTGSGAGTIIFPPVANWLISHYQWRLSIAIVGIVTIIVGLVAAQFIKKKPGDIGQFPDGDPGTPAQQQIVSGGYSFKEAIHIPQFWITILIFFCCGFFGYSILVHIIPFSIVLGIHQATSAGILAVIGGISILGGFCSGALTDRIGVKKSLTVFLMIALCSLIWLVFSQEIWQLYLFAVIFGLGYGSIGVAETIISVWLFGLKANALILSIIDLGLTLGAASGPLIAGRIFDITESYRTAFILTAVMSLSGLLLTLFLKPLKTSAVSKPIGE